MRRSVIIGTGSYIPSVIKKNSDFEGQQFYSEKGDLITVETSVIVNKLEKITGISERRYATDDQLASDLAGLAAKEAVANSGIDPETLDMIIVAHNFGDTRKGSSQTELIPSLASKVKKSLEINNPGCIAFDVLFGCPGWVLGIMQADAFFKAGMAKRALVIGAETLSRVIDLYDRDSMIFSDGAGATVLEYKEVGEEGILSSCALSHCVNELGFLNMDEPYRAEDKHTQLYMKMKGRKVYEYALTHVPQAMKECLDKSGVPITALKKIFIHQANEKMDEAIVAAMYKLYGIDTVPEAIMPMCIQFLGNSSVATVPTLYDLVKRGCDAGHSIQAGDVVLFASVGAGMNINAVCYRL